MTYRTQVFLPDDWAAELERLAVERGVRPAVLARMAVIQWLREQGVQPKPAPQEREQPQ